MRKLLKISLAIAVIACMFCFAEVRAADATLSIEATPTEVKQGETFTITIKGTTDDEINGLSARLSYDSSVLECDESSIKVGTDLRDAGAFPEIAIYTNKAGITSSTLYTVTFKVKANATVGNTTIVLTKSQETGKLLLATLTGDGKEFEDKSVTVKVTAGTAGAPEEISSSKLTSIAITTQPKKASYKVGEKFDKTGMVVTATYEDGTKKEVTSYTYTPSGALAKTDKVITVTYSDGGVSKTAEVKITVSGEDATQSSAEKLAQTGIADNGIALIVAIALVVVSYIGIRKYRNV